MFDEYSKNLCYVGSSVNPVELTNLLAPLDTFLSVFPLHIVGIDLHRKLQLMERNSNARNKRGRMPSFSFHPPEEVYVIDDDSEPLPQDPTEELPKSGDSNALLDSM